MRFIAVMFLWLGLAIGPSYAASAAEPFFKAESFNAGLPAAPDDLNRYTPQATMESLLDLAAKGDFATAAQLLDLRQIPDDRQATRGPELARKLYEIIDRKIVINWDELLDRPDGLDAQATSDSAVAGQPRRSLVLWRLGLGDRSVSIRMNRIKPGTEEPVWVFSRQLVENIDGLYREHGPSRLELMLPAALRKHAFWNMVWWEVIGLPVVALLALLVGFTLHRLGSATAQRVQGKLATDVIKATRSPMTLAGVTTVIAIFTQHIFIFSGGIDTILSPLIAIGFVTAALMLVINVVDAVLDRMVELDDVDLAEIGKDDRRNLATKVAAARRALIVIIFLVGSGIVLAAADVFRTFGFSLLASAGAITLILGFAAREVLGNIMASMQIAINQSARIGDKILYKDWLCNVERINFTFVQLRVWTGERLVVPVSEFITDPFENWTMKEPEITRLIRLKLSNQADVGALRERFVELLDTLESGDLGERDNAMVAVTDHDAFGQEVTFCLPCSNPNTAWMMACEMREKLIAAMREMQSDEVPILLDSRPAKAV